MMRSGYNAAGIRVVYNPAPPVWRGPVTLPGDARPVFVFLGRLVPQKGVSWLIEAVAATDGSARFVIVGEGPERLPLRQLSERLGVAHLFRWEDWIDDRDEVFQLLSTARAVIFPSLWHEPAGLVTLEAAAVGRPVITSRVGGIPEYVERLGNAILVEPGDVMALANSITQLTDRPDLADELGRRGQRRLAAGEFGLDGHLDQLESVYTSTDRCG